MSMGGLRFYSWRWAWGFRYCWISMKSGIHYYRYFLLFFIDLIYFILSFSSESCQKSHWKSGHKEKCEEFRLSGKSSLQGRRNSTAVVPGIGNSTQIKKVQVYFCIFWSKLISIYGVLIFIWIYIFLFQILFPYDQFVELFNWDSQGFPPCGLLNCGNRFMFMTTIFSTFIYFCSCFAALYRILFSVF